MAIKPIKIGKLVLKYINIYPDMAIKTLCDLIFKENKKLLFDDIKDKGEYKTLENIRSTIRYYKGHTGTKNFKSLSSKQHIKPKSIEVIPTDKVEMPINKHIDYTESKKALELGGQITSEQTDRVKILQEFLELCKVDEKVWEVDRFVLNAWDTTLKLRNDNLEEINTKTNYQIKVWLKKRKDDEIALIGLIDNLYNRKPIDFGKPIKTTNTGIMYEICLFDLHFGKLAWLPETGENYDLTVARKLFLTAIKKFSTHAIIYKPELIVLPIGNDFLHCDNSENTTNKGTKQDVDGRLAKIYDTAFNSILDAVDILRTIAKVKLLWVAGNHDLQTSYFLCKTIEAYYHNCKDVEVDVSPMVRKRIVWGKSLIAFEHGEIKEDKLPLIMADTWKEDWSNTIYHEYHIGHFHKKKEMVFTTTDTHGSCIVRRIASLTRTDYWHFKQGYVGNVKSAEAFIWDKENGMVSTFNIYI